MDKGITHKKLYDIFKARDARFDGRYFVGVTSTGIYCRTVCSARMPKEENCRFFRTAAEAEAAGFRPCMTCRPEQAPGLSPVDASSRIALSAARLIECECSSGNRLPEIAHKLGCSDRHLRIVFTEEFHVSPVQYQQTCRLLLAKNLLTDTNLSVLEVAMASGFGSLRQFNNAFREKYQMSPTALRRRPNTRRASGEIAVLLGYRKPYCYDKLLNFLEARAIPGVELVSEGKYYRTVRLQDVKGTDVCGWISVKDEPEKSALLVVINDSLLPVLPQILGKLRQMFDLYCDPEVVASVIARMNQLKPGLFIPGIRIPGCFDPFEMAVRAVLGQQITVKAACTLSGRIASRFGTEIQTEHPGPTYVFPTPAQLLAVPELKQKLGSLGVIASRAAAIESLARAFEEDTIDFSSSADPQKEMKKLLDIKGVGPWTAQYIAMRTMAWTDAFPQADYGIKKALDGYTEKERAEIAERWRPWRSYATMSLWNSLE